MKEKLIAEAIKEFGFTDSCTRAGYILPNGEMLDFGDKEHPEKDRRNKLHEEIRKVYKTLKIEPKKEGFDSDYPEGLQYLDDFVKETDSVRLSYTFSTGVETRVENKITKNQWDTIEYCTCTKPESDRDKYGSFVDLYRYTEDGWDRVSISAKETDCVEETKTLKKLYEKARVDMLKE